MASAGEVADRLRAAGAEIYLVGGAVRDRLLGRDIEERDYVVVGATAGEMRDLGFRQVGRDFPVFLHPVTRDEYALARTERKTAPGYRGFVVHAERSVTLRQDLERRDLTINALAEDRHGNLVDYFGGRRDLEERLLRHVSPAFAEDPVRILRVARFAARFDDLGFAIADETLELMGRMVREGEVDALVPERVWQELEKALGEARPARFFEVLRQCGALARLFPEIDALFGVPQPRQWHPEIDTGVHTLMVLDAATRLSPRTEVRFAALTHDLGKGETAAEMLPSHKGHEERGVRLVETLCARYRAPARFHDLAVLVARLHGRVHHAEDLGADEILDLLEAADAIRRPERFEQFLLACEADFRGREGFQGRAYPQAALLRQFVAAALSVDTAALARGERDGERIRQGIRRARVRAISSIRGWRPFG